MPTALPNFVAGRWIDAQHPGQPLIDPVLGNEVARVSSQGIDYAAALRYGRDVGGAALRELSYGQRAVLLGRIADVLTANKDAYYRISLENSGATRGDAAFDVDGAIFTLKQYARSGATFGDARILRDGETAAL